ncbi:MAG TPA: hypothetical protein VN920_12095 [Pyrinomonadaceae bacterium]|nr:hypothetical protein [Pyrinomonadaceae bacterium]
MKKMFGILLLVVTLLSGITVLARNPNSTKTERHIGGEALGGRPHRRHYRHRWHRWHRRHGRHGRR